MTIEPDNDAGSAGHAIHYYGDPYSDIGGESWNLMVRAITSYAGHIATQRLGYDEDDEEAGAENDYRDAAFACDSIAGPDSDRCVDLQKSASDTARMMVDLCWNEIKLIASALEEKRTLSSDEVEKILKY